MLSTLNEPLTESDEGFPLEVNNLIDIDLEVINAPWKAQGAAPAINGQVENVNPENQVIGAIHTVLADPDNADNLWVGAVNGGIWRTTNATAANPNWTPLTDEFRGLSIGALEFDPTDTDPDGDGPTIIAGIGHFSSYGESGGPLTGLLLSTDDGDNFTSITPRKLRGRNISGVAVRGKTIVVSANELGRGRNGGVYRSKNGGKNWKFISGRKGLATGAALDLVGDPTNTQRLYVSIQNVGIFRSDDSGANWINISKNNAQLNGAITGGGNNNTEMAVASNGRVYAAVLTNGQPSYIGFTDNPTAANPNWTEMDLPITLESNDDFEGLNPREKPGGQGAIHFSIIVDPNNSNIVYVGGDRQDSPFTNAIGANDFSGRLFRGDTTQIPTNPGSTTNPNSPQWQPLTHGPGGFSGGGTISNSAPHADSREMTFDANGDLIEVDDGGIYRRTNPGTADGDWFSIIGDLQVTEQHDIAYDPISNIIISGNQDTGTTQQQSAGSLRWSSFILIENFRPNGDPLYSNGDGGDVAVSVHPTTPNQSVRYSSFYDLRLFRRQVYDENNIQQGDTTFIELNGFNNADRQFNTPVVINAVNPNRLIIGGSTRVYESFDQGDNVAIVNTTGGENVGVNSFDGDPIAYGANDNEEILYIGSGSTVSVRREAGGTLDNTDYRGQEVRDIVLDIDESTTAFAIDDDQVFQTTNTGTNWTDITGDLSGFLDFSATGGDFLRSIEYIPGKTSDIDAVVIGSTQGVFGALSDDWDDWFAVGPDTLPNAPVWDIDYDATDEVLVVGTLGRGAWLLTNVEGSNSTSWGDVHLSTFDGVNYDFQAVGEFILVESTEDDWEVQTRQEFWRDSTSVSVNTAFATEVDGHRVVFDLNFDNNRLEIDGISTPLADGDTLTIGNSEIVRDGHIYTLTYAGSDGIITSESVDQFFAPPKDDQLIARDNGDHINIEIFRTAPVQGILGNIDGNPDNDFMLRDGTQLPSNPSVELIHGQYADSWRIDETKNESLFKTRTFEDSPAQFLTLEDLSSQAVRASSRAVRAMGIPEGDMFDAAVFDLAVTNDINFLNGAAELFAV